MAFTNEQKEEIQNLLDRRNELLKIRSDALDKWLHMKRRRWLNFRKNEDYYPLTQYEQYDYSKEERDVWSQTFFMNFEDLICECNVISLTPEMQKFCKNMQALTHPLLEQDYTFIRVFALCSGAIPCEKGSRLFLSDPYGSLTTSVLEDVPIQTAEEWVGQILDTEIGFRKGSNEHPLRNTFATGFRKYDKMPSNPANLQL